MTRVAIGLGSNLGDRFDHLTTAFDELGAIGTVSDVSSIYETAPVGGPEQGDYLNAVAVVETDLTPQAVLADLLRIEHSHGRTRRIPSGPRTLDLDLLVYEGVAIDEPGLTLPHPRLAERRFALEPLAEVWPEAPVGDGRTAADLVAEVAGQDVVLFRHDESGAPEAGPVGWQVFAVTIGLALAFWWLVDLVL